MPRTDTKIAILEAAARVVLARGVAGLTLEAVAAESGLSKGGLLYHFATKEALLAAMVDRLIEVTEQRIEAHREQDRSKGNWVRGYLEACTLDAAAEDDPAGRLAVALLAAGATEPELVASLRARQDHWREMLRRDGIDPVLASIVRLAADGLWMNDIFGIPVLATGERRDVLERLCLLTRE
jgi:AcrR family transcriptional regulator